MPVRAAALGASLEPCTAEVTTRMTLAYSAALGELSPSTFDDAGAAPLVAPPAFCVGLEWPALVTSRTSVLGLDEAERRRAVHVEQDSTFHRPIRPGLTLTTAARIVAVRSTRAGALVQTRLVTSDLSGAPVVTSWHTAIYRGVSVAGADGRLVDPPAFPPAPGDLPRGVSLAIPREAGHLYSECTGIWNPIHTERRVALAAGLPDIILHGTAAWAMAGREIVKHYARGDHTRLRRLRARFRSPIVPGGVVALAHGPGGRGEVHFQVTLPSGETALGEGYAEVSP